MSLPRVRSLREHAHFVRVRRGVCKPAVGRYLLLSALGAPDPEAASLYGIITPRYVGKAHERNLVRRRLRAIIAGFLPSLNEGMHVVTLARRPVKHADYATLLGEWEKLARRAGIFSSGKGRGC